MAGGVQVRDSSLFHSAFEACGLDFMPVSLFCLWWVWVTSLSEG